jgi:hypothetical protein
VRDFREAVDQRLPLAERADVRGIPDHRLEEVVESAPFEYEDDLIS